MQNQTVVAKYKCDVGFYEKDSEERRCSPVGTFDSESNQVIYNKWTGNKPKCIGRSNFLISTIFGI